MPIALVCLAGGLALAGLWWAARPMAGQPLSPPEVRRINVAPAASPSSAYDAAAASELASLRNEVKDLRTQLDAARSSLDQTHAALDHTARELERLRRPLEVDMASATLRANLTPGEGVVTGGYRLPDGNRLFAFVETDALPDGAIGVASRFYSVPEELVAALGLETLTTEAANTLQHGEVWVRDELTEIAGKLEQTRVAKIISAGNAAIRPGDPLPGNVPLAFEPGAPPLSLNVNAAYDADRNLNFELRVESLPPEPARDAPSNPATPRKQAEPDAGI